MIATINGSPSAPARTNDSGVPPTPRQTGRPKSRHGARQANSLRACRSGREDHRGCRVEELLAMVLTDPEHVEPDLIGVFDLVEQIAHTVRLTDRDAALGQSRCEAVN